jgi:cyanophycinase
VASKPKIGQRGVLVIIGGHEDKSGAMPVLREVVERSPGGPIIVATLASQVADELWPVYRNAFRKLGVRDVHHLDIERRSDAADRTKLRHIERARAVFLTGGDQLRLTSKLGGTSLAEAIRRVHERGGVIAGTSAGASVMSETMLVAGAAGDSVHVRADVRMAPGLGFVRDLVIDQHFAQRGRIGRLLAVVAQNPRLLGVGIDENTAIVLHADRRFQVIGKNAVYVVDGRNITHSNVYEDPSDAALSVHGLRLHLLAQGDEFDLNMGLPRRLP